MTVSATASSLLLLFAAHSARGLLLASPSHARALAARTPLLRSRAAKMATEEGRPEKDTGEYSTDWDGAWAAELAKRSAGNQAWRPEGREPVTEEQVLKARATKTVDEAQQQLTQATADWRFWLGLIAVLSVASAVATRMNSVPQGYMV